MLMVEGTKIERGTLYWKLEASKEKELYGDKECWHLTRTYILNASVQKKKYYKGKRTYEIEKCMKTDSKK